MNSIVIQEVVGSGELWLDVIRIICGDTHGQSMIDIGAFRAPYTPLLGFRGRTYVDIQDRPLDHTDEQKWFVKADAIEYLKSTNNFYDIAISSDSIEHFPKIRGYELLQLMEYRAKKQVVFTPLGEASVTADGHPDSHASGWLPEDLPNYLCIIFPRFHDSINIGAFWAVKCSDEEKQRIHNEIKQKYVQTRVD